MKNSRALAFYIAVSVVAFVISKIVISILLYKRWCRKHRVAEENMSGGKIVLFRSTATESIAPKKFLKNLKKLTNKDIIGSGGHGIVYKLEVDNSAAFAVKRLNRGGNTDRDGGFQRELDTMGDIKHRNIVTLHGYYMTPQFNLLIYDFMPNGGLDGLLHGNNFTERENLNWPTRYKIAVGTARGICYLHHDCVPHIIHRDIKSSNILLDLNMEARVSDFGLATLMEPNQTHVSTVVAGTWGYLPPEYFDTGKATAKGDVYSFGVVLVELLTGKRTSDETFVENGLKLVTWVKDILHERREEYAVDRNLVHPPMGEIKDVFRIAEKCLEADPFQRPSMREVVKMLEKVNLDKYVSHC